jgi:hypothetical protein
MPLLAKPCAGLRDPGRAAIAIRRALSSRCVKPFALSGNSLLELRIRDVETVLCRQFDAHSLEPLVPANGEAATLAELSYPSEARGPKCPTRHEPGGRCRRLDRAENSSRNSSLTGFTDDRVSRK